MVDKYRLHEIFEFWRTRWKRAAILILAVAFVAASLGVILSARHSAENSLPQGTKSDSTWLTLGARSKAGTFSRVSLDDLNRFIANSSFGEVFLYAPLSADVRYKDKTLADVNIGFVSDGLLDSLHLVLSSGALSSSSRPGVVVSKEFFDKHMGGASSAAGETIVLGSNVLPVVGVLDPSFQGFGGIPTDIFADKSLLPQIIDLSLPIPDSQLEEAKSQLLPQLSLFYGFVKLHSATDEAAARHAWRVAANEFVNINLPPRGKDGALKMKLGFSTLGQVAEVVRGITLDPERTRSIQAMTSVFALLAGAAVGLAILDVLSFWLGESSRRQGELNTRIALGATRADLINLFSIEAVPFVLAYGVVFAIFSVLLNGELLSSLLDRTGVNKEIASGSSLAVATAIGLALFVIGSVSAMSFARRGVATRGVGGTKNIVRLRQVMRTIGWLGLFGGCFVVAGSLVATYKLSHFNWGGPLDPIVVEGARASSIDAFIHDRPWFRKDDYAFASVLPLANLGNRYSFYVPQGGGHHIASLATNQVSPNFFSLLGVDLIDGSGLDATNEQGVLLSVAAANALGINPSDAIGRRITQKVDESGERDFHFTVLGVVADLRYDNLAGPFEPVVYELAKPGISKRAAIFSEDARIGSASHSGDISDANLSVRRISEIASARTSAARRLLKVCTTFALVLLTVMAIGVWSDIDMIRRDSRREAALRAALGAGIFRASLSTMAKYILCVLAGGGLFIACVTGINLDAKGYLSGISVAPLGLAITSLLVATSLIFIWAHFARDLLSGSLLDKLADEER